MSIWPFTWTRTRASITRRVKSIGISSRRPTKRINCPRPMLITKLFTRISYHRLFQQVCCSTIDSLWHTLFLCQVHTTPFKQREPEQSMASFSLRFPRFPQSIHRWTRRRISRRFATRKPSFSVNHRRILNWIPSRERSPTIRIRLHWQAWPRRSYRSRMIDRNWIRSNLSPSNHCVLEALLLLLTYSENMKMLTSIWLFT